MTSKHATLRDFRSSLFALVAACGGFGCSDGGARCGPTSACDAPDAGHEGRTGDSGPKGQPDSGATKARDAAPEKEPEADGGTPPDAAVPLAFIDTELPRAAYDTTIVYALRYRGGTGVPEFTVTSGRLPRGLGLMLDGTLFGTPYEWGDFEFEVELKAGDEVTKRVFSWRVTTTLSLAYLADDREPGVQELFVADIGGGAPYARAAVARADYFWWMRDGKAIAFHVYSDTVSSEFVVDLEGATPGKPKKMWEGPSTCSRQWSPDETMLAVRCDREIRFYPRDDRKPQGSVTVSSPLGSFQWSPDSSKLYLAGAGVRAPEPYAHAVIPASARGSVDLVPVQFTEPPLSVYDTWSPNSNRILLSARASNTDRRDLYLVDAASSTSMSQPTNLNADRTVNTIMLFAGWTTDGRVAYAQGRPREIHVLTKDLTSAGTNMGTIYEDSLTGIQLVRDDTFIFTYDFSGSAHVETRSPAGTGWERDLVGGYALSDALMHNLVVTDDGDGHRLMAGKMPSWNSRALNIPSPGADISYYLYSPDATRVAFVQKQPDGRLRPFYSDLRSGSALGVPIGEASTQRWPFPAFSPDSRFVAYVIAKEGPIDLQVVDVSAQVPRPPVKVNGEGRVGVWPAWQPHWP